MEMGWLVMRTRSRHEAVVRDHLEGQGIQCYLPKAKAARTAMRPGPAVRTAASDHGPLFPGYVFVKPRSEQFTNLKYIRGSCGLICFNGRPASVGEKEVESIRIMTDSASKLTVDSQFLPGEKVTVISGPLRGIEGELVRVKNVNRLVLNILILGQAVSMEIGASELLKSA